MDLNLQYVEINARCFRRGNPDYLALIGSEEEVTTAKVAGKFDVEAVPSYIPMKPILPPGAVNNVMSE